MRLVVVVGALLAAVLLAPIGADPFAEDAATPEPTAGPSDLSAADQRTLELGRTAPEVGRRSPAIVFNTFDGTHVELHKRTRPVVLVLLDSPCTFCDEELGKVAVMGTILYDEAWTAVVGTPASEEDVRRAVEDAGAAELAFAGADDGSIVEDLNIERTPAVVVLDSSNRIAAMWQRSVPAAVVLELVRTLNEGL